MQRDDNSEPDDIKYDPGVLRRRYENIFHGYSVESWRSGFRVRGVFELQDMQEIISKRA